LFTKFKGNGIEAVPMLPFQVEEELGGCLGEDGNPSQPAHVGANMNRVYALVLSVNRKDIGQLIGEFVEKDAVEA